MNKPNSSLDLIQILERDETGLVDLASMNINLSLPEDANLLICALEDGYAMAAAAKRRITAYRKSCQSFENNLDRTEDFVKSSMIQGDESEIFGTEFKFQLRNSKPKLIIEDESQIPESYKKQVWVVDEDRVREDLALGVPVDGARLEKSYSLYKIPNTKGRVA